MHRRRAGAQRQRVDANSAADRYRVEDNVKCVRARFLERLERRRDIFGLSDFEDSDFEADDLRQRNLS
jgi:hypothetical protein